jgi:hypothetical protein
LFGRQLASVEVAALRRLGNSRRVASMTMRGRRDTASPTVTVRPVPGPTPRHPLNKER